MCSKFVFLFGNIITVVLTMIISLSLFFFFAKFYFYTVIYIFAYVRILFMYILHIYRLCTLCKIIHILQYVQEYTFYTCTAIYILHKYIHSNFTRSSNMNVKTPANSTQCTWQCTPLIHQSIPAVPVIS